MVKSAVNAGDDAFDIQCGHDGVTVGISKDGYLYNLFNVEQFDFEKPWWPKNIVEQLSLADRLYVGSNYLSYNGIHWTRVLMVNKDKFDELGKEIPYQKIIDGKWYVDDLLELIKDASMDLDGNGKMNKEDFYGFVMGGGSTYCLQDTFGISCYEKSEDGLELSVDMDRADKFVEKMRALINDEQTTFKGDDF